MPSSSNSNPEFTIRFGDAFASSGSDTTTSSMMRARAPAMKTTFGFSELVHSSRRERRSSPSTHERTYFSGTEPRHVALAPGATTRWPSSLRISPSACQCSASVWFVAKSSVKTLIAAAKTNGTIIAAPPVVRQTPILNIRFSCAYPPCRFSTKDYNRYCSPAQSLQS